MLSISKKNSWQRKSSKFKDKKKSIKFMKMILEKFIILSSPMSLLSLLFKSTSHLNKLNSQRGNLKLCRKHPHKLLSMKISKFFNDFLQYFNIFPYFNDFFLYFFDNFKHNANLLISHIRNILLTYRYS